MADRPDVSYHGGRGSGILPGARPAVIGCVRRDRHDVRSDPQLLFPCLSGGTLSNPDPGVGGRLRLFMEPLTGFFSSFFIAAALGGYGVTGALSLISGSMLVVALSIGLMGPKTSRRSLETLAH
jgi:hypothetical protein